MKNNTIFGLLLLISLSCFGQKNVKEDVEKLLKAELKKETIKSAFLHIYSTTKEIDIQLAESKMNSGDVVSINTPFYTASITKMLTATAIGILKDEKKLNFEDTIAQYLPKKLINKLHVFEGKEYSESITIAQLLQHTSGLPDYFTDATIDGSPNIINQLLVNTNKSWSAEEIIQFTKEKMQSRFVPGNGYHYSDTEYVLLGLIIEKISGLSLDEFFKQHIFKPLGMNSSYLNLKSSPLNNKLAMAEFYVGNIELSSIKSLSADWGGGGLVATTKDLIRFLEALRKGQIVRKETYLAMQQWTHETKGMKYGFGLRKVSLNEKYNTYSNFELIGHTGSTASFLWYCPQLDTYIAGTLNQLEASKSTLNLVYNILKIIKNE
ncbi:serine hydrolase domain-containing protein [Kordia periserrulae]|nr:serine hydrolase domain-containing protein [Kordia periserrulae]